jgi:hypothetical protein
MRGPSPNTTRPHVQRSHPRQPVAASRSLGRVARGGMKSVADPVPAPPPHGDATFAFVRSIMRASGRVGRRYKAGIKKESGEREHSFCIHPVRIPAAFVDLVRRRNRGASVAAWAVCGSGRRPDGGGYLDIRQQASSCCRTSRHSSLPARPCPIVPISCREHSIS